MPITAITSIPRGIPTAKPMVLAKSRPLLLDGEALALAEEALFVAEDVGGDVEEADNAEDVVPLDACRYTWPQAAVFIVNVLSQHEFEPWTPGFQQHQVYSGLVPSGSHWSNSVHPLFSALSQWLEHSGACQVLSVQPPTLGLLNIISIRLDSCYERDDSY